jgi:alkylated DNA nucleotide flippase Atl1
MTPLQRVLSEAVRSSPMTYREIGDRAGMARKTVSEMVNGRVRGSLESWQRLLDATGAQVGWKR